MKEFLFLIIAIGITFKSIAQEEIQEKNQLRLAGEYLKKSAKNDEASLFIAIGLPAVTLITATSLPIIVYVAYGATYVTLKWLAMSNKRKAGEILAPEISN